MSDPDVHPAAQLAAADYEKGLMLRLIDGIDGSRCSLCRLSLSNAGEAHEHLRSPLHESSYRMYLTKYMSIVETHMAWGNWVKNAECRAVIAYNR